MKKTLNTSLALILVTVLAFVCISKPLQARADSASMDYVETDMSTSEVKALFSGSAAFIPAAIMIIGFIVMTYCVLRNIEVPLQFSDQTSFSDKLTQLGQYAIDNAGDSIKDFLYSVYTYCNDNGITSIWGLSKFIGLQAGKFFGAITSWIGGSLVQNPTSIGEGLVNSFTGDTLSLYQTYYSYSDQVASVFPYNSISFLDTIGYSMKQGSTRINYEFYTDFQVPSSVDYIVIYNNATQLQFAFYDNVNGVLTSVSVPCKMSYFQIAYGSSPNTAPNLSTYTAGSVNDSYWTWSYSYSLSTFGYYYDLSHFMAYLYKLCNIYGLSLVFSSRQLDSNTINLNETYFVQDVLNPAVDNVYVPTDEWVIDLVGTWEQIRDAVEGLNTQTEKIAAFVGDIPLTLTSAQSYAPTINDAGNYVFPDMTDIWKYPQYFFDTLKGWGSFVGNCLRSVTVGEGGLSWIFYGGFVLLVCGGIIGKILMG